MHHLYLDLSSTQFGFRKKHSTSHAATHLTNIIGDSLDKKRKLLGIFLDLRKAFDTVDYNILLAKFQRCGVRGTAYEWFVSYFTGRLQRVHYHCASSNECLVTKGVPQGSVLGPLLFSLYINELHDCLEHCSSIMFTDDTSVFTCEKDIAKLILKGNADLQNIHVWLAFNKLSLNVKKTNCILFKTKSSISQQLPIKLTLRNETINQVHSTKFLGLTLDENLSWKMHMQYLLNQIRSIYGTVKNQKVI